MKIPNEIREEKFAMIRRWTESGLSQKQFCEKENVTFNNFQYWLKRFRNQHNLEKSDGFIKIQTPVAESCAVELILLNGNRIRFFNKVEVAMIKNLAS